MAVEAALHAAMEAAVTAPLAITAVAAAPRVVMAAEAVRAATAGVEAVT